MFDASNGGLSMIERLRFNNKEQNLIKPRANESDVLVKRAKSSSILIEESAPK